MKIGADLFSFVTVSVVETWTTDCSRIVATGDPGPTMADRQERSEQDQPRVLVCGTIHPVGQRPGEAGVSTLPSRATYLRWRWRESLDQN